MAIKPRAESSFGLHFDFHASEDCVIGGTLQEEDIREICQRIRPDFIQIDCKGHPGWASYPTALGNAVPHMVQDTLALWRRVTREEGVALYMHYSGVWDAKYCAEHPEDCVVRADGTLSPHATRTLGSYADRLLIPQLKELAGRYGVDGAWVDGECWGTEIDYHPDTVAAFEKETGISLGGKLPVKRGDAHFEEYLDFNRELFRRYVRYYVDEVHKEYPDFQLASNWAFTDHMPEPVCANVDFLSGDFDPWNSLNVARYAGRVIAQQNRPWDLMAWNFRMQKDDRPEFLPKHPIQTMQEAASVLSLGGGFQNYITQYRDGSPRMEQIRRMKPVADFIRAREAYCFRATPYHEAVLLLSTHNRHREAPTPFPRVGIHRMLGLTSLLCDSGLSLEIACEHTLHDRCHDYRMIVLPEHPIGLGESMIDELISYVEQGGNLLLTGVNTCRLFADRLGYTVEENVAPDRLSWVSLDHEEVGHLIGAHTITAKDAETVVWFGAEERGTDTPGALVLPFGRGKVALLAADIGQQYHVCHQFIYRHIIKALCARLYTPLVRVEHALGTLEVFDTVKNGMLSIQLLNVGGYHLTDAVATEDQISPVVDIELSIELPQAPKALVIQPDGRALPFRWCDGRAYVSIDRLDIHSILQVIE